MEVLEVYKPNLKWAMFISVLLGIVIIHLPQVSEFIYTSF
jgi:hypothetical protein